MTSLFSLEGKVALVTGGSRGIGEMIAHGLVAAGATVYVASRKLEVCEAVASDLRAVGGEAVALEADLSTPAGCEALAAAVAAREDVLHVLVNNAGATWGAPIEEYPVDGFDKVMDLNVRGVFLLTRALLPQLEAAGTPDDPARVVNIGSVDGIAVPAFDSFAYSASKAAVHHLTRHLAKSLAARHITVNAIAPGLYPSKMTAYLLDHADELAAAIPRGRLGQAEDLAGTTVYLASRAGAYTTGAVLPVDGGVATLR
ncbi:SDR family NAD(P)-dependent oxidoreductase [Nitriliruptor alkaliphilus]|uniref:SDR family NAD(P)-dependent oxidoreductase n=1 Tax=Nitriliruptor alkaliphilus TaxID=427918 RepID=UPI0006987915